MDEGDRLARLEARVARLEELAGQRDRGAAGQGSAPMGSEKAPAASQPRSPAVPLTPAPPPRFPASPLSSEQWIGQRVLLAIGVGVERIGSAQQLLPIIQAVARRQGVPSDQVDDVVQDVLLSIHRARQTYAMCCNPRSQRRACGRRARRL